MSASGARRGPNQETQSNNARPRRLRRGERRRLTREDINTDIRRKEEELANLLETRNSFKKRQRDQRAATLAAYKEKDQTQAEVDRSYKDISAKSEEMNRIKAVLIYQQADRHDDAIRRIEGQLRVNNFKLSDEKRLVQEIDALRKSKRDLSKYQQMRASLDEMRARLRTLKSERDSLFEKIKGSKRKEDELKRRLEELLPEINQVKRTIEELQQRRQQVEVAASSSSGDEGCPAAAGDEHAEAAGAVGGIPVGGGGEAATIEIELEDFDERQSEAEELAALSRQLTVYLRSLLPDWAAVAASSDGGDGGGSSGEQQQQQQQQRRRQAGRRLQRSERVLTHPPDVFAQFYRLTLRPPTRVAEIPDCLQRLLAKTAESEEAREKSPAATTASAPAPAVGYARSLSNPSNDESGFSETTSVRPESPETNTRPPAPPAPLASEASAIPGGTDDLLSTSSTICSEENPASSATESPPLPPAPPATA